MADSVATFLMFQGGHAEAAMNFYVSLFADGRVDRIERYGAGEAGKEGSVKRAAFTLAGQSFMCIDSPMAHGFGFTPAISIFVTCRDAAELGVLYQKLSAGGSVMMPLDAYPFAEKFAWVADRYGVSWQMSYGTR